MADEVLDVWGRIKDWPDWMRQSLASKIVQSLQSAHPEQPKTLGDLVGLLASDQPPPTDKDVRQVPSKS